MIRNVRAARVHVIRTALLGLLQTFCVIATALSLGKLGADLLVSGISPLASPGLLAVAGASLALRALALFGQQRYAHRAATDTISQLRSDLVRHTARTSPRILADRGADVTALATKGLDNLRPYLTSYVPQLLLAATVTPICLAVVAYLDLTSALIAGVTLPLIPVFMILIGLLTQGRSERLLLDMRELWSQVMDLVQGLPTLRALGREHGPEKTVHELGTRHYNSTMGTLRYAFLSAMALELLATLCVALIAVSIGLRLVAGNMELFPALAVLILAPEIYLPLRQVGAQFHASTDGLAALDETFNLLATPLVSDGASPCPPLASSTITVAGLSVASRNGYAPHDLSFTVSPGNIVALAGANGSGKSTTVHAMLGLLPPDSGEVRYGDTPLTQISRATLWNQLQWLPQRPLLSPGTVRELLGARHSEAELLHACQLTGFDHVLTGLDNGLDTPIGRDGVGLSVGQRQRLALTRCLLTPSPLVILDEPTAHLDAGSEATIAAVVRELSRQGRTVLLVAHRKSLLELADKVVTL